MDEKIRCIEEGEYLLVEISDRIITFERAQEILNKIGEECSQRGFDKVLLDERSVERREVPSVEIMKLSDVIDKNGLRQIHMAFWCIPELINKDSERLSLYTFTNEYIIKHFPDKADAIAWLLNSSS